MLCDNRGGGGGVVSKYKNKRRETKPKTLLEFYGSQELLWNKLRGLKVGQGIKLDQRTGRAFADTCENRFGKNWRAIFGISHVQ